MGSQSLILDTHVVIWFVEGDERLGRQARKRIETSPDPILISAITPWEIAILVRKERIALSRDVRSWVDEILDGEEVVVAALEPAIAIDSVMLPGGLNNDPADRIIVATARHHSMPLLTVDQVILDYGEAGHVSVIDARR
jgi:PIN domain nuclease of toxin-antitoxin system